MSKGVSPLQHTNDLNKLHTSQYIVILYVQFEEIIEIFFSFDIKDL